MFGVVLIQEANMTTRSKKKSATTKVAKPSTNPSFAPNPVTADMNTHIASGTNIATLKLPADPRLATDTVTLNAIAPSNNTPSLEITDSIALLDPAPDATPSPTPPQIPIPLGTGVQDDFLGLFKTFMTGQAEFQRRSTVDASAFRQMMEHSLTSLQNLFLR
jgi:hypothetical protein